MKFVVSSSELVSRLQIVSRVVAPKPTFNALSNILFQLKDSKLTITASDVETTLRATMPVDSCLEDGSTTIACKLLIDALSNFPEQPITFTYKEGEPIVEVSWATGKFKLPTLPAQDFPEYPPVGSDAVELKISSESLLEGINRCAYATANEELRPIMNGIFFDIKTDSLTMVASDAHKLICYKRADVMGSSNSGFVMPKKPANIIKSMVGKTNQEISIMFDSKNIHILFADYQMVSRRIEGNYPAYANVIPKNNNIKIIIDRSALLNATKRVAVCANQGSNLIRFSIHENTLGISAQDLELNVSANESIVCQHEGEDIEIGFKSIFLIDILSNISSNEVCISLCDPTRAGIIMPQDGTNSAETLLALLMPMQLLY